MIFFQFENRKNFKEGFFEHLNDSSRVKENVGGRVFIVLVMKNARKGNRMNVL